MAEKILRGINFPGLEDTYMVMSAVDTTLTAVDVPADAKAVGDALAGMVPRVLDASLCGNELPEPGIPGRIFFRKVSG
jgi:hypothetical protein